MQLEELLDAIADDGLATTLDALRQEHKIGKESTYQVGEAFNLYSFETEIDGHADQVQVYERTDNGALLVTASPLQAARALEYADEYEELEGDALDAYEERIIEARAPERRRQDEKMVYFVSRSDEDRSEILSDYLKGSMGEPVQIDWDNISEGTLPKGRYAVIDLLSSSEPLSAVIGKHIPQFAEEKPSHAARVQAERDPFEGFVSVRRMERVGGRLINAAGGQPQVSLDSLPDDARSEVEGLLDQMRNRNMHTFERGLKADKQTIVFSGANSVLIVGQGKPLPDQVDTLSRRIQELTREHGIQQAGLSR